ncbi:AbiJ-NTD4 domain-containing protein [Sinorhizobium meliloti]|uniref:AbiJ-NTD4 domain-containing protein n=1 Tax=Rhizobium meliloti TaxID=382 RepID=UPI003012DD1C
MSTMMDDQPFSRRHNLTTEEPGITVRYEAPRSLRYALAALGRRGGLSDSDLLEVLTQVLLVAPQGNWSPSYIEQEVNQLLYDAPWPSVYDCAESLYLRLKRLHEREWTDPPAHEWFEAELNVYFRREGIGWQMESGHIEFRGPKPLEDDIAEATRRLDETARATSSRELEESRKDLSRRPEPDVTGAIQHALAAVECLVRDLAGDPKATLGDLIKRNPGLFPKPLDEAIHKLWGFASEFARHIREGRTPSLGEAVLVVGLASSVIAYLLERETADRGN